MERAGLQTSIAPRLLVRGRLWEQLGFEAWRERRDFLLPLPSPHLQHVVSKKMASHASTGIMSQALAGGLASGEGANSELLLEPGLNSERAAENSVGSGKGGAVRQEEPWPSRPIR